MSLRRDGKMKYDEFRHMLDNPYRQICKNYRNASFFGVTPSDDAFDDCPRCILYEEFLVSGVDRRCYGDNSTTSFLRSCPHFEFKPCLTCLKLDAFMNPIIRDDFVILDPIPFVEGRLSTT